MSDKFEALKAAAEKYSVTLNAHQHNPKDFDALVAWDTATSEITSLINNDEISIITSLLAALEEKDQQISSWRNLAKQNIAEREKDIAALEAAKQHNAELEQRLQQPIPESLIAGVCMIASDIYYENDEDKAQDIINRIRDELQGFKVEGE